MIQDRSVQGTSTSVPRPNHPTTFPCKTFSYCYSMVSTQSICRGYFLLTGKHNHFKFFTYHMSAFRTHTTVTHDNDNELDKHHNKNKQTKFLLSQTSLSIPQHPLFFPRKVKKKSCLFCFLLFCLVCFYCCGATACTGGWAYCTVPGGGGA